MCLIIIPTSHAKLYFGSADLMSKTPFINLVMTGCWPTGIPSILINVDNEDRAAFVTVYPPALRNKSYKNNKICFIVVS